MDTLIIVRHGEFEGSTLSDFGRRQIRELSGKIAPIVELQPKRLILSSHAPRAKGSAEILGEVLQAPIEEHPLLFSGGGTAEDLPGALALVRQRAPETDVLVLVTHYEYAEYFHAYYGKHELQTEFRTRTISKGSAWVIECGAKKLSLLEAS